MRVAKVEFHHGRGCDLGTPYGGCISECRWDVVEFLTATRPNDPLHGIDNGPCLDFAPDTLGPDPEVCTTCFYVGRDHTTEGRQAFEEVTRG